MTFFYRHMPALIDNGFIYIAQPPLFKVTRKKSSTYIRSEREMDEHLLELGTSDIRLLKNGVLLQKDELGDLARAILEIESFIQRIERKGVPFREYIAHKSSSHQLPRFMATLLNEQVYVFSEEELAQLKNRNEEEQRARFEETLASIPVEELTEQMREFRPKGITFVEFYDDIIWDSLQKALTQTGFSLDTYLLAGGDPLYIHLNEQGREDPLYTLKEVIDTIRLHGRKDIEVQRYKGLGEMNPDQLWETTMDPAVRTLVKVEIGDLIETEHMFTKLMGEEVPPRRAFIEQHALSVKNLDI
jgi:DNA gyrase subunit B